MASAIISNLSPALLPSQLINSSRGVLFRPNYYSCARFRLSAVQLRASSSSTAFVDIKPTDPVVVEKEAGAIDNILACPVCYEPLSVISEGVLTLDSTPGIKLQCSCCKKRYSGKDNHLELTAASGATKFGNAMPLATEFFRIPFMSFLYERGWRQNFVLGGFPGPEKEFELIKEYLNAVLGGNIVDASCGSGLFSRLFAKSGLFSLVVALDYSESMLQQCYEFIKQEENLSRESLLLVRADISRLPFTSCSIDAVHAGAAIHCWPSPSTAVAEICRVLKPGGVFVGSTYILDGPFRLIPLLGPLRQNLAQLSGNHSFISERELEDICTGCGLVDFKCTRNRQFIMFSAQKPS